MIACIARGLQFTDAILVITLIVGMVAGATLSFIASLSTRKK